MRAYIVSPEAFEPDVSPKAGAIHLPYLSGVGRFEVEEGGPYPADEEVKG